MKHVQVRRHTVNTENYRGEWKITVEKKSDFRVSYPPRPDETFLSVESQHASQSARRKYHTSSSKVMMYSYT